MTTIDHALRRHVNRFNGGVNAATETDPRIDAREALRRQMGEVAPVVPRQMAAAGPAAASESDASPTSPYGGLMAALGHR